MNTFNKSEDVKIITSWKSTVDNLIGYFAKENESGTITKKNFYTFLRTNIENEQRNE